jgi:membrane protein YqaA with SNARE-associated domain
MHLSKVLDEYILKITDKITNLIKARYGLWFLGFLSFAESALLVPIITDPFMVTYMLVHKSKTTLSLLVTVLTSVIGGVAAYVTAAFFMDLIKPILSVEAILVFEDIVYRFHDDMFLLAFLGAVTPLPYTLTALAAGTIKGNLLLFILGSFVGRMLRYGIVAYLTYVFGEKALGLIRKNIIYISIIAIMATVLYVLI